MPDVTSYIGKEYPLMNYGAQASVSASDGPKARLEAERDELLDIRALIEAEWSDLVDTYYATVTDPYESESPSASPPSGSTVTKGVSKYSQFGAFQCWVKVVDNDTAEETWYFWGPSDWTVMSNDGPEPRAMVMEPTSWMIGSGDVSYLNGGAVLLAKHRFGEDALVSVATAAYSVEHDETTMGIEVEGTLNGSLLRLEILATDGSPASDSDVQLACNDLKFIDTHIYGLPSTQGTQGVVPKIKALERGNSVMTSNVTVSNQINDFYRGNNILATDYTTWTPLTSAADIKYVNTSGGEWLYGDDIDTLDQYSIAIKNDMTASAPSGTNFLLDMTVEGVSSHRYTAALSASYHETALAHYTEVILSPDIYSTINFKAVTASNEFGDLMLDSDLVSLEVSGGSTYTDLLYKNQLTVWIGGVSASQLPLDLGSVPASGQPTPITAAYSSGPDNYFNVFKKTDGDDPFAGYTVVKLENGLPITYQIDYINTE